MPKWSDESAIHYSNYASGYAKARPGNPVASVAQFVAELRDLPQLPFKNVFLRKKKGRRLKSAVPFKDIPKRLREQAFNYKSLGSEYLNVQFGWMPFISDLRKMYNLWHDIDRRMAQIIRENDKTIRRRATVESQSTIERGGSVTSLKPVTQSDNASIWDPNWSTVVPRPLEGVNGAPPNFGWTGRSAYTVTRTVEEKVWFSGHFRYHIPDVGSSQWNRAARLMLFGAIPTPETVWELTPWSWLIDWFSNVGDVISNASPNAVGFPICLDSCIMHHVKTSTEYRTDTYVNPPATTSSNYWTGGDFSFTSTYVDEIKSRGASGNPFGLGVKLSSLTNYQLSILAALGVSRSKVK
jgi:hypothetical protein